MAGSTDPNENPVAINVVPMVDVIFCLCVFFMCSMKFKQIEGEFDAWLPHDRGFSGDPSVRPEIRIAVHWDTHTLQARRQFGARVVEDDAQLESLIAGAHEDHQAKGQADARVLIDGDPSVPWAEMVEVADMAKRLGIDEVEFALGAKDER